jgi:hypothetical protein
MVQSLSFPWRRLGGDGGAYDERLCDGSQEQRGIDGSVNVAGIGGTFRRRHSVRDEGVEICILIRGIRIDLLPLTFQLPL